jgi:hypothetical protein
MDCLSPHRQHCTGSANPTAEQGHLPLRVDDDAMQIPRPKTVVRHPRRRMRPPSTPPSEAAIHHPQIIPISRCSSARLLVQEWKSRDRLSTSVDIAAPTRLQSCAVAPVQRRRRLVLAVGHVNDGKTTLTAEGHARWLRRCPRPTMRTRSRRGGWCSRRSTMVTCSSPRCSSARTTSYTWCRLSSSRRWTPCGRIGG